MFKKIKLNFRRFVVALVFLLFFSAVYLYAFPAPTLFYAAVVLLHAGTGVVVALCLLRFCFRYLKGMGFSQKLGWLLLTLGAIVGLALIYLGTTRPEMKWMYLHIALSVVALILLAANGVANYLSPTIATKALRRAGIAVLALAAVGIAFSSWSLREGRWKASHVIKNPSIAPLDMDGEGDGPQGPFFPSSAQVVSGGHIPSKFFMESDSCKRCHADVYKQWYSSVHHFSSFNNQWYRKSIEYMQEVAGTKASKWCGGCHDPAVLYSGLMDTPIKQIVHRPEAQAGLGCMMCHSIVQVKSTMGQGDFFLEYPKMHELAASKNRVVRAVHDFLTYLNPEPHRRAFLKPFMRTQTAEFCSSCHKVHLDVPVNNYRWFRGFNEYDNWQASGVSGFGARSFYYPPKSQQCADCHMPLQHSQDAGNIAGMIHSHRFPAANTALPIANQDPEQLRITEDFLKNKAVSVDIFAIAPARPQAKSGSLAQSDFSTSFGVGEEAETKVAASGGEALPVTAPLNRVNPVVRRGDTIRVDVVARTRTVGHFFPGGTVDAYDTWLELKATDDRGQTIFWSGKVEDEGKGPVEKGAHFYRTLQVDAHGHPINKRNAWANRAVVYVRLIPPGAADTVHYRLQIPKDAGSTIKLHARMCYRKFAWWNTQFSFAGIPDPHQPPAEVTRNFDDRRMVFTGSTQDVSAVEKRIPDVPTIALAEDEVTLQVVDHTAPAPAPRTELQAKEWTRWNDYGIGLLLQGDLKNAQAAFEKITQMDPKNPDGWVNIGRAAILEGDMERARAVLKQALTLKPELARANFFYAKVLRNDGDYDGAADHLRTVLAQYPKDRVALNDLGRILFLKRRYQDAVQQLQAVLAIDPEDLQANYNLMLCHNGLGNAKQAREYELRYLRFKADESSQALTGSYRILNPEDNQERQAIHEHGSALPVPAAASTGGPRQKQANKQNAASHHKLRN